MPHVDFVIQLFCPVSSCPYRKGDLFVFNSLRGLYLANELTTIAEVFKCLHSNRWKTVLVLSSLKTYNIFFDIFWTVSDVFKADILLTCDFLE